MSRYEYTDFDREVWVSGLDEYVPSVVYDMHTHMWSEAHAGTAETTGGRLRTEFNYQDHLVWAQDLYPGREFHLLVLGTPVVGMDAPAHNHWLAEELKSDPTSVINMMVTPDMTAEFIAAEVVKYGFLGLKPYRTFAPDPGSAPIADFLPEHQIEVAHDMGLAITMHLSKFSGAADPENQADLERYTKEYSGAQWILAHCARGFNSFTLEESIHFLKGLPNVWYDTSAVNDLYSHYLLMKHEDRKRIMYGSDNIVAGCERGKYITYGRAWSHHTGTDDLPHCDPRATLVIYEQLHQERQVADMLALTAAEIEDHFSKNAVRFIDTIRGTRAKS